MNIELKNIKVNQRLSRETHCFSATVYIDGKRASIIENDGQGGADMWYDRSALDKVDAYARTLPPAIGGDDPLPMSAEILIGEMINRHISAAHLQKILRNRIVFTRGSELLQTGVMAAEEMVAALTSKKFIQSLRADQILNLMGFEDALKVYRKR